MFTPAFLSPSLFSSFPLHHTQSRDEKSSRTSIRKIIDQRYWNLSLHDSPILATFIEFFMISPAFHLLPLPGMAKRAYKLLYVPKNETQLIRKLIVFNCVYKICSHLDKSEERWTAFNGPLRLDYRSMNELFLLWI